ncbi:MAG: homoserine kinase [Armatimonadetes bacterium]|nr:homoserine kinase [Armatimonadota bacterium]
MIVRIRVPASTTNLGPGFDALGMALRLHNRLEVEAAARPAVEIEGEGADRLPADPSNLVYRTAADLLAEAGRPQPALRIRLRNEVPVGRGLGSSATAIVGGLLAANALLGEPFSREELLRRAVQLEGHPDNVTPALMGGLQVVTRAAGEVIHLRLPTPAGLHAVVAVPDLEIATADARAVLPACVAREDAVFNVGRAALLVAALTQGRPDLLGAGMADRLHQPYRARLLPGFEAALAAARAAGACGACLSGSGSSLLALTRGQVAEVGAAMCDALHAAGLRCRWMALEVDEQGAVLEAV